MKLLSEQYLHLILCQFKVAFLPLNPLTLNSSLNPPSFLLAKEKDTKKSLGFINFRFDLDEGVEVAYWLVR